MTPLTRKNLKPLAKRNPAQIAKIVAVQEQQIKHLLTEIAARDALLTAVIGYVCIDRVDEFTGEVFRERPYQVVGVPKDGEM
jgi:hypothetical protein